MSRSETARRVKGRGDRFAEELRSVRRGSGAARGAMVAMLREVIRNNGNVAEFLTAALEGEGVTGEELAMILEMAAAAWAQVKAGRQPDRPGKPDDRAEERSYPERLRRARDLCQPSGWAGCRPRAWRSVGSPVGVAKIDRSQALAGRDQTGELEGARRHEDMGESDSPRGPAESLNPPTGGTP